MLRGRWIGQEWLTEASVIIADGVVVIDRNGIHGTIEKHKEYPIEHWNHKDGCNCSVLVDEMSDVHIKDKVDNDVVVISLAGAKQLRDFLNKLHPVEDDVPPVPNTFTATANEVSPTERDVLKPVYTKNEYLPLESDDKSCELMVSHFPTVNDEPFEIIGANRGYTLPAFKNLHRVIGHVISLHENK